MYRIVKQALKNRNIKSMAVGHLFKVSNLVLLISNLNLWISLSPTTIASYQQHIVILLCGISGSTIMSKYGYTTYYYYLRYPCKRFSLQSCLNTYIDLPPPYQCLRNKYLDPQYNVLIYCKPTFICGDLFSQITVDKLVCDT